MFALIKVNLKDFIEEQNQKYNVPNSSDSIDVINAKLKKLSENLVNLKYCIPFSDYRDLVGNIREIAKNSDYCKVYHSFSDSDLNFYGVNESDEKLKDSDYDCEVSQFMIEIRRN